MIAIIKYNAGNVKSVENAIRRLGFDCRVTDDKEKIVTAEKVILPGVGEASSAMNYLKRHQLVDLIKSLKQPVLGICLGQQLMCSHSEEGDIPCMGIFNTAVKKFPSNAIVPHMGWNSISDLRGPIWKGINADDTLYFVHSYYAEISRETTAICDYILPFSAAMQKENFYGTQFHPEKSAGVGERILFNFLKSMRIIPAIDIIDGKCVRLAQGDYSTQKIYNENPLEVAKEFEAKGIQFLHLVDLDGARSNKIVNYHILNKIATNTSLKIDFGGGLKSNEDIKIAFENGASQITGGSIAVADPKLFIEWLRIYGAEKIILGADSKNRKIATHGWMNSSEMEVVDFIDQFAKKGVRYAICTDISKDGILQGPSNELYLEILKKTSIKIIASGGVSSIQDLLLLKAMGCEGVIVGRAIYEKKIALKELINLC